MLVWKKCQKYCVTLSGVVVLVILTFSFIQFQIHRQSWTDRLRTIHLTYGCGLNHTYTVHTYMCRAGRNVSVFSVYSWHKIPSMHSTIVSVIYHSLEYNNLLQQRQAKCKHSRRLVYYIYIALDILLNISVPLQIRRAYLTYFGGATWVAVPSRIFAIPDDATHFDNNAIIWTNDHPIHWRIYAALRGDELNIKTLNPHLH